MPKATKNRIRVMLVDEHPVTRHGIRGLLEKDGGFEVVGDFGDAERAEAQATQLVPDVVVVDIALNAIGGVELARRIKASVPSIAVVALTVHDEEEYVDAMLEAGASGYLLKTIGEEELVQALRSTLAGEFVLDPTIARKLIQRTARPTVSRSPRLAQRDIRILLMIAEGLTNEDIARQLGVSARTAKLYISSIFDKLGTNSRTSTVVRALQMGWIRLEDISS